MEGYDHFALIALTKTLEDDELEIIEDACQELRYIYDDVLFGKVHHLSSKTFGAYWWDLFNDFMMELYNKTKIEKVHLYFSEFDGETLERYTYIKGKKNNYKEITLTTNDKTIQCHWNIKTLKINHNITSFYNNDYEFIYS